MNRNGRNPGDGPESPEDDARPGPGRRGVSRGLGLSWGGLAVATMGVLALALVSHKPGDEPVGGPGQARFRQTARPPGSVAFAPDGRSVALGFVDGGVEVRDLERGRPRVIAGGTAPGLTGRALAYSPDGRTLASGGLGRSVELWDAADGSARGSLEGHAAPVGSLSYAPDGRTLASGSLDGAVKLWEVATGRERVPVAGHKQDVRGLAFSPDGRSLASGSLDGAVKLWEVATGRQVAGLRDGDRRVYSLAFSPDGRAVAVGLGSSSDGSQGRVILWNPAGAGTVRVLGLASFAAVAFSPDGKTLAAAGGDRVVKLWDVETGRELPSLAGHEGFIASLAFSPDGRFLATAGQDALYGLFPLKPARQRL